MILHTVIDPLAVMGEPVPQLVWQKADGGYLQKRWNGEAFVVERAFSTDPAFFLCKEHQPGRVMPEEKTK